MWVVCERGRDKYGPYGAAKKENAHPNISLDTPHTILYNKRIKPGFVLPFSITLIIFPVLLLTYDKIANRKKA
jgi:hypothetical protein